MSDLHPNWQSDSADTHGGGVRISVQEEHVNASTKSVSRTPAAIVGILATVAIGMTAFGGWELFAGQATQETNTLDSDVIEIKLTGSGPVPASITATPGSQILWINEDTIPHILESETLKNSSGNTLYTPAIFPGARFAVTIDPQQPDGSNAYESITSSTLKGTIVIAQNPAVSPASATSSSRMAPFGGTEGVPLPGYDPEPPPYVPPTPSETTQTAPGPFDTAATSSTAPVVLNQNTAILPPEPSAATADDGAGNTAQNTATPSNAETLPYNPYTVAASGNDQGSPLATNLHNAPRQPDSGPGLWVSIIVSLGAMTLIVNRSMRGIRL